ncbi:MAG: hypothetical protein P8X47_05120 [Ignavibacteriaceae bacterium]
MSSIYWITIAQDCKATFSIQTNDDSAKLFIDGEFFSKGNNFIAELDTGLHTIELQRDLWKWNSNPIRDTINVTECKNYERKYSFENKILFDTNPQDVYVFENDSLIGFTPLLIEPIDKSVTLKKPDYASLTTSAKDIELGVKPVLQFVGHEQKEDFYETTWFKVLVSTAVALGATTAYYKLEADKKFDEYQITGDPALLDQTDKYDVISGVTFVAMQINFGLILYLFLAD